MERKENGATGINPRHETIIRVSRTTKTSVSDNPQNDVLRKEIKPIDEENVIEVHKFATTPACVSITLGGTINLGDFNSSKFAVTITKPCYAEEIDAAFMQVKEDAMRKASLIAKEFDEVLSKVRYHNGA